VFPRSPCVVLKFWFQFLMEKGQLWDTSDGYTVTGRHGNWRDYIYVCLWYNYLNFYINANVNSLEFVFPLPYPQPFLFAQVFLFPRVCLQNLAKPGLVSSLFILDTRSLRQVSIIRRLWEMEFWLLYCGMFCIVQDAAQKRAIIRTIINSNTVFTQL